MHYPYSPWLGCVNLFVAIYGCAQVPPRGFTTTVLYIYIFPNRWQYDMEYIALAVALMYVIGVVQVFITVFLQPFIGRLSTKK